MAANNGGMLADLLSPLRAASSSLTVSVFALGVFGAIAGIDLFTYPGATLAALAVGGCIGFVRAWFLARMHHQSQAKVK